VSHVVPLLVRGINNLSDARYCAGMGADKLTFVLDPALPNFIDAKAVKELAGWVAGVELIGEFDQLSAPEINAIAADCGLDAVLLRSFRTEAELAEIAPPTYVELAYALVASTNLNQATVPGWHTTAQLEDTLPARAAGWLVELPTELPPHAVAMLQAIGSLRPLWLGPGLHPDTARQLAQQLPIAGLALPSGDEVKPGLRDFDLLEAVFEALEVD